MFIDQGWRKKTTEEQRMDINTPLKRKWLDINYTRLAVYIGIGVAGVIFFLFFIFKYTRSSAPIPEVRVPRRGDEQATSTTGRLPTDLGNVNGDDLGLGTSTENLKAEEVGFGAFYQKEKYDFQPNFKTYQLPINIKASVANYYDVSRKINLDPYLDKLNTNGFAILSNQFADEGNDFFSVHRAIAKRDIPLVITSDFILYYYQNVLKEVYKEIEQNAFYDNLWATARDFYQIALTRYKNRLAEVGLANDTILEATRQETVYFAVLLELLKPIKGQINNRPNFTDVTKFTSQEAEKYTFNLPIDIKDTVKKEVELIRAARDQVKSPVFLYWRDYEYFKVPANYSRNAKLNNFYLATKWLNSVFPLYYRNKNCEQCSLDYNDWLINFATACFITKDFNDNQDLKNQWAIIYKFISFFSGLRRDLTYLDYEKVLSEIYGQGYSIENIFSPQNENRNQEVKAIQEKIGEIFFPAIEGGMPRTNVKFKPQLGMRILQEAYWPNDYIFNRLSGEEFVLTIDFDPEVIITACPKGKEYCRCVGFGRDIINLLEPIKDGSRYFKDNTSYRGYDEAVKDLRQEVGKFDIYTWHNNIYWTTLNITKYLLNYQAEELPIFSRRSAWRNNKIYNTVLGTWVNLHLPADQLVNYYEKKNLSLGVGRGCNKYNYIEPNISLINELIAEDMMLQRVLWVLRVTKKTNAASIMLKELNNQLKDLRRIMKKELNGGTLNSDDCRFIIDFAGHYVVDKLGKKNFTIAGREAKIKESFAGVKLLGLVYYYPAEDKKILTVGPIFNYQEKK
jgi:hypothetical protein